MADWSALANRHVTIWPDNDVSGKKAAAQIASFLRDAGAASVAIVDLPEGLPDGWDLADPIPDGVDIEALVQEAGADRAAEADLTAVLPAGYSTTRSGLTWTDPSDDEKPPILLCGPIEIMAETRDGDGASWGGRHELEIQRGPSS